MVGFMLQSSPLPRSFRLPYRSLALGLLTAGLVACSSDPGKGPVDPPKSMTPPNVRAVTPANGAINVSTTTSVSADVQLLNNPAGNNGIDPRTINDASVKLVEAASGVAVPATENTSGGGDSIVLQPTNPLKSNTKYTFQVTPNLKDLNGVSFKSFQSSFTTGVAAPPSPAAFRKVNLSVPDQYYTNVIVGPDRKLYASTLDGLILRFGINADGTLGAPQTINSVQAANNGPRTIIGMTFDPTSTAGNLILWISNNNSYTFQKQVPDWTGKITRLSGSNLENVQDYVVGLPRSTKDHMTNAVSFRPTENNALYISQGANNSMGDPDPVWDYRPEHLLSASLLRLDLGKLNTASLPLNAKTEDGGNYDPFAANAPLTLYATGIRNAYSMVWHSNGQLYMPTNGSAAGGNAPATPTTRPAVCANRADQGANGYSSTGGFQNAASPEPDYLFRVDKGGYYGHPNPSRCEYVLNGGNEAGSTDSTYVRVNDYPSGVKRDPNYREPAYVFDAHASADGAIEYVRSGSVLNHKLLVVRYSAGKDIVALDVGGNGGSVVGGLTANITGFTGFSPSPLSLVEDRNNGNLYVTQLNEADPSMGKGTISLLKPQ